MEDLEIANNLIENIAENLRYIENDCPNDETLSELNEQTRSIAANLRYIHDISEGHAYDETREQTDAIVENLRIITDDGTDLDALEKQLDRILAKLDRVAAASR